MEGKELTVVSDKKASLLNAKYFCKVDHGKANVCWMAVVVKNAYSKFMKINVVLELSTETKSKIEFVEFCYVLVIDVSGSMGYNLPGKNYCMLDRIKIFAVSFVDHMVKDSWLSIITFSHEATTSLKLTKMDRDGRLKAKTIIGNLAADGGTSIRDGLLEGLLALQGDNSHLRGSIILFTDGEDSFIRDSGTSTVDNLVDEYNALAITIGKKSRVAVSAFTIGGYKPYLLYQISLRLGCETFYWLNENCDFEADLFIPMCLRESTTITDIAIKLTCLEDFTFSVEDVSGAFLERIAETQTTKNLSYFIHFIPKNIKKNLCFSVNLPNDTNLGRKQIVKVEKSYFDYQTRLHEATDFLELRLECMKDVAKRENQELEKGALDVLSSTCAYSMVGNKAGDSWADAQESFIKVLEENVRVLTANMFQDICLQLKENIDLSEIKQSVKGAMDGIERVKTVAKETIGSQSSYCQSFCKKTDNLMFIVGLEEANLTLGSNWGRLASIASSLFNEMPPASGVFPLDHPSPHMPQHLIDKLQKYREVVKLTRPKKPFKLRKIILSERLSGRKTIKEHITTLLIQLVSAVGNNSRSTTILLCDKSDYKRKSRKVKDAIDAGMPIVKEGYIYQCIEKGNIIDIAKFLREE